MPRLIIALSTIALLTACANSPADHALAQQNFGRLMGKQVQIAFNALGPADRIIGKPTGKLYQWSTLSHRKNDSLPADYDPDGARLECTISVITDDNDTIRHGRIEGNVKSCTQYDNALNDYFPTYPNGKWVNNSYIRRAKEEDINN